MGGTFTPNLHLYKPLKGEVGWDAAVNANFDVLDSTIEALEVEVGAGVSSVFGRNGAIVAQTGDYSFSQISGKAGLAQGGTNADLSGTGGASQVLKQVSAGAPITVGQLAVADISGISAIAGSGAWSALQNASANLTLSNAAFTTEFDQTTGAMWKWKNTTTATSGTTNASPVLTVAQNYWTGAASAEDNWTLQSSLAAGTNGVSTLSIAHSGSSGVAVVQIPSVLRIAASTLPVSSSTAGTLYNYSGNFLGWVGNFFLSDANQLWKVGFFGQAGPLYAVALCSGAIVGWTANVNSANATFDTLLSRIGVGQLAIGSGNTQGDFSGSLTLGALTQSNPTVATSGTTNASPIQTYSANYWTGAASAVDTWTVQSSLAAGTNGASTLAIAHAGGGFGIVSLPSVLKIAGVASPPLSATPLGTLYNWNNNFLAWAGAGLVLGDASQNWRVGLCSQAGNVYTIAMYSAGLLGWTGTAQYNSPFDTVLSRLGAASLALGNGTAGDFSGSLKLTTVQMGASAGAPTSAGTAGTAGQIIFNGALLYFCSVSGAAGSATWNKLTMSAV